MAELVCTVTPFLIVSFLHLIYVACMYVKVHTTALVRVAMHTDNKSICRHQFIIVILSICSVPITC